MSAKVITANLLRDGDVVYLTAAGAWSLWPTPRRWSKRCRCVRRLDKKGRRLEG